MTWCCRGISSSHSICDALQVVGGSAREEDLNQGAVRCSQQMSFEYSSSLKVKSMGHPSPKPSLDNLCLRPGVPNPWTTQQEVSSGQASKQSFIYHLHYYLSSPPVVRSVVALDSHRSANPTVHCACKGSRWHTPYKNHPETIPPPCLWKNHLLRIGPWCQKDWGPLSQTKHVPPSPHILAQAQPGRASDGLYIRAHWSPLAPGPDSSIFRKLLKFYVSVKIAFKQLTIS